MVALALGLFLVLIVAWVFMPSGSRQVAGTEVELRPNVDLAGQVLLAAGTSGQG